MLMISIRLLMQLASLIGFTTASKLTQMVDGERRNVVFSSRRLDEGYCHPECSLPTPAPVEEIATPAPITPRPTAHPTPHPTPQPVEQCPFFYLDFANLQAGTYVHDELMESHGVKITAIRKGTSKGHTPINGVHVNSGGGAMVFDTLYPTGNDGQSLCSGNDGDPDLGSPNQGCPGGGPGVGSGGAPSSPYANCVPQGKVLVIQESNKSCPDDSGDGGFINFEFNEPTEINLADILDIDDNNEPHIHLYYSDASGSPDETITNLPVTHDNGFLSFPLSRINVKMVSIEYFGSGCISGLSYRFCPPYIVPPLVTPAPVTPQPTPNPTPAPIPQSTCGSITYSFENGSMSGWTSSGPGNNHWRVETGAECVGSKGVKAGPHTGSQPVYMSLTVPAGMNKMSFQHTIPSGVIEDNDKFWVSCGGFNIIEFENYYDIRANGVACCEEVVDVSAGNTVTFTAQTSYDNEYWEIDEITFFCDLLTDFEDGTLGVWTVSGPGTNPWRVLDEAECVGTKGVKAGPHTGVQPVYLSRTVPAGMNRMSFKHSIPAGVIEDTDKFWVSCGGFNLIEFENYSGIRANGLNCEEQVVAVTPGQTVTFTAQTSYENEYWEIDEIIFFQA